MARPSPDAPKYFRRDLGRLTDALEPWAIRGTDEYGDYVFHWGAPENLERPYWELVQMGYARGWFE